jgi:NAD-dependent deacetylase
MSKPRLVVLTGAGISAESGISTFRGNGGLWDNYRIEDVATPEAFEQNPETVLAFYNQRRRMLPDVEPNAGHRALVELEKAYDVHIVTQNIDDLHERAGSSQVHHLHGELRKARSSKDPDLIYDIGYRDIAPGEQCDKGSQLRPHVVWFGEPVPMAERALHLFSEARLALVVGTSLLVMPASNLLDFAPSEIPKFYVDPEADASLPYANLEPISAKASEGVPQLVERLLESPGAG